MKGELRSNLSPKQCKKNIAALLSDNVIKFGDHDVYREKDGGGHYRGITWSEMFGDIRSIAFKLKNLGFSKGDKMVLFSRNRREMLELELALMAMGGVSVPIFANFKEDTANLLINHSKAKWLAVAGQQQLNNTGKINIDKIICFDSVGTHPDAEIIPFDSLLSACPESEDPLDHTLSGSDICLNMYTSGTMGIPKCVQLTHGNILSQQAALEVIWNLDKNDRFLSYLPWHHSFGGIFELFTALYNGATLSLESGYGKDPDIIFENWKKVQPTVFFSVPKVYQALVEKTRESKEAEDIFFNTGLKFIFTAAAALPEQLTKEFEKRGIPVIEGWGLTETSPCCTLTDPNLKREPGVVGKPIPGVSIRIADDDEIQVSGPNVMISYFDNEEANKDIFTDDGWYRTGDVGALTETGLKLISRKDRIFKLSNGEKVVPTDLERAIEKKCHYVQYVVIAGSGKSHPVALIFPNKKLFDNPDYRLSPEDGCFCPRNTNELGKCLTGCLHDANCSIGQKFAKVKSAAVIDGELSLDDKTLTPSMKMAPKVVLEKYQNHLHNLYGAQVPADEEVYIIELDTKNTVARKISDE